ncbi:hypothetical protein VTO73DRAFT_13794 [Trametes versicolor]
MNPRLFPQRSPPSGRLLFLYPHIYYPEENPCSAPIYSRNDELGQVASSSDSSGRKQEEVFDILKTIVYVPKDQEPIV